MNNWDVSFDPNLISMKKPRSNPGLFYFYLIVMGVMAARRRTIHLAIISVTGLYIAFACLAVFLLALAHLLAILLAVRAVVTVATRGWGRREPTGACGEVHAGAICANSDAEVLSRRQWRNQKQSGDKSNNKLFHNSGF